jgi:Zn-dependent protease with chaperone function
MEVRVNKKENLYFIIKVVLTIAVLFGAAKYFKKIFAGDIKETITASMVVIIYSVLIWLFVMFQKVFLVGYLKGNGIEITQNQFPEIYQCYYEMGQSLRIKKMPPLFIIQQGGSLNAFAIRFSGKNYIAVYSDIFEMINSDVEVVKFILGHELGHVKRHHMSKMFWTSLSCIVPFVTSAYSRSCEYTCDNIGNDLSRNGSLSGLLVLAAGKKLYKQINIEQYIEDSKKQKGFALKFTGICSSHPFLPKRLLNVQKNI